MQVFADCLAGLLHQSTLRALNDIGNLEFELRVRELDWRARPLGLLAVVFLDYVLQGLVQAELEVTQSQLEVRVSLLVSLVLGAHFHHVLLHGNDLLKHISLLFQHFSPVSLPDFPNLLSCLFEDIHHDLHILCELDLVVRLGLLDLCDDFIFSCRLGPRTLQDIPQDIK